ncbi:MAG TPA: amino acid permease, partial [Gemmatimonadaceae bacterium]|nr:amino acid permease [Gemmatimonadaceae bacterium]
FDATMLVMGGIVGAGIFMSPHVVARHVQSPPLILGAWIAGGAVALIGAFVYAELAALRPAVGGVYAYIRDAFHPVAAFLYGWTLLLVVQSGGMAAVAVTFARYFNELAGATAPEHAIAVGALVILTVVNWLGVRAGSNVQNALMMAKILAILTLVTMGWVAGGGQRAGGGVSASPSPGSFAAALVPVLFAYGGWQTASFVSGELDDPRRDLPRGLLVGISGVVLLYLAVNVVCLRVLGPAGLAATPAPATAVMRVALGDTGARLVAAAIAISTIGFLSQSMLTAPRVYYAMARDGLFFRGVGSLHPRTRAPAAAIGLQGAVASGIAFLPYERILNYVVAIDALFFGLTGAALLVFRRRERSGTEPRVRTPGHPVTTIVFVTAFWLLALSTVYQFPRDAGIGVLILAAGVPVYLFWVRKKAAQGNSIG